MTMTWIGSLMKRPLYLLLPVVAVALALWAFWPRALPVEIAEVVRAPLSVTFSEEGRTRLRQRYRITAPIDGFLQRIELEPGDPVSAGAVVAVVAPSTARLLDPATQITGQAQVRAAEQTLAAAQASLSAARAENTRRKLALARLEALAAQRLISKADLDLARADATAGVAAEQAAQARVEEARALRDGARAALQAQGARQDPKSSRRVLVRAPAAGRVVSRNVESEGPVQAGQALFEIGDPTELEVEVEILSADAVRIAVGTPVQLLRWGGEAALQGRVRVVEPGAFTKISALGVEEQRVKAIIDFDTAPASHQGLGDGYRVEARFQVWHRDAVLQVPIAALFRDGEHWSVYAIEDGRARLRHLKLGRFGEHAAELREGLAEGAQVVLYPGDNVREGSRVARDALAR